MTENINLSTGQGSSNTIQTVLLVALGAALYLAWRSGQQVGSVIDWSWLTNWGKTDSPITYDNHGLPCLVYHPGANRSSIAYRSG